MFSRYCWLLVATLLLSFSTGGSLSAQSSADWDWMSNHFDKALDDFFPVDERYGVYVAYRSHRDLHTDIPEYSFVIGPEKSDTVSGLPRYLAAHVREAESASVYDQMMALHRKFPNLSPDDIQKNVHVKTWNLNEMNCPAIKAQFSKLEQVRLAPPQFDVVILHPLIHEFRIRAGDEDVEVALYNDENPLVQWAIETRHALELCAADSH
ncbi:MAG: hypothetical protein WB566_17885 [Terriglobales bacterium]